MIIPAKTLFVEYNFIVSGEFSHTNKITKPQEISIIKE
jgi:hypothetical protein